MIGMGAVGAIVGKGLLAHLGSEQFFCIAEGERKERYEKDGILINNERQNFNFITPEEADPSDLVIIATKNLQLKEILPQIKKAVGPHTIILSLLNGMQSERDIAAVYGSEKVLYSFIVGISSVHEKNNIICSDSGIIVFGEKDNTYSPRIEAVSQLFTAAGQKFKVPADIHLELWKKFLMNVTCNTISALCRAPYGTFRFDVMKDMIRDCGLEVVEVANAEGISLTEQMIEDNIAVANSIDPKGKTSMFQDIEAGRKTENEWFCGTVIELAQKHHISVPICTLLKRLIQITELSRQA